MFFSKFIIPAVAVLGLVSSAFATPVASEIVARDASADAVAEIKAFADIVLPVIADIEANALVVAKVTADISLLETNFNQCKDSYGSKPVNILVDADLDVFVSVCVEIMVKLVVALSACITLSLDVFAQVDVFLSAWLTILNIFAPGCGALIGNGIPLVDVAIFTTLKLLLSAKVLAIVNLFGTVAL